MNKKNPNVLTSLESAHAAIRRAVADLDRKAEPDIRAVEVQVDLAAAAATSLSAEEAKATRPALLNLVAELNDLHSRVKLEHKTTARALGSFTTQRRAVSAYARQPRN